MKTRNSRSKTRGGRKARVTRQKSVRQLTIRGFDEDLERAIREEASAGGISLNQAVLRLVRKAAGLAGNKKAAGRVGNSLDHLAGTWTEEEAREFDRVIEEGCERIDEESWK